MAVIMLASVFAAMAPTGMSRPTATHIDSGDTIFIGEQNLGFNVTGAGTYTDIVTLEAVDDDIADTLSLSATYTVPNVAEGKYYHDADSSGDFSANDTYIFVKKAEIIGDIMLNTAAQDSIVGKTVPTTAEIVFKADMNFGGGKIPGAQFRIVVTEPAGTVIETIDTQPLRNLDATVENATTLFVGDDNATNGTTKTAPYYTAGAISLADLDTGTYTVEIKTEKTPCNMLDISSSEMTFTIRSEELSIEAAEDETGRGEDILLKVNGNPSATYYFAIENVVDSKEPEIEDTGDIKNHQIGKGEGTTGSKTAAWIKTGSDGVADVKITTKRADERTYTMNVYDGPMDDDRVLFAEGTYPKPSEIDDSADDDYVDVEVTEAMVVFDIPSTVVIGEEVTIKGTVNAGDEVDILVEDEYIDKGDDATVDEDMEFEVKWKTEGMTKGSYTIDVYINCPYEEYDDIKAASLDEDGKTSIRLVTGELTAEQPRSVVAEDDDYAIEGTATGTDMVDIVLIGPDGYPPADPGYGVENGLELVTSSVDDDNEFSEDIAMVEGVDTGAWIAVVASPGRDGDYGSTDIGAGNIDDLIDDLGLNFAGKDRDQIMAILTDNTIDVAGSDDLVVVLAFKVESGYVDLNPAETVAIGEPLNLTGVTNREPGAIVTIDTFAGPMELPVGIAEVEWPTADEGVFAATIDTTDAVEGTYTLEADDGDGNTDTITVVIGAAAPTATPTPEPTAEPTATAIPTPAATAEPTAEPAAEPTPEEPGFEAVFAIAGLLSIAYLVLRRRK
ncbi:MAG: PGF-CTERM sorting domain-containing protein [Halobacteriota archaeon]